MIQPTSIGIIAILVLLSGAPGSLQGTCGSIARAPEPSCFVIDLRLRPDYLDSAWNCRIVIDRIDLHISPVRIADRLGEPIGASQVIQKQLHTARLRFVAVRVLGRFVVRRIIRWIGLPVLHQQPER